MNGKSRRALAATLLASLVLSGAQAAAQSKAHSKPSSSQEKADPLAPLLQQAQDSIDKMDFAAALDPLQKYIAQRPDDPYAHFQLGYSFAGLKRPDDAKVEFSRAITLDPKMEAAHLNLGLVLMDSDPAAAADAFRHAAELQPTESRPRFLAGFCLEHAGKFPEAIEQYRGALALSPKDYEAHFALGRTLLRTGDAPGAEAQFRNAIAARETSAPARLGLSNALLDQKKYAEAADALDEYLKLKSDDQAAHFARATALYNLNRLDDALMELDRADAGSTSAADSLKMRADIYTRQKNWKNAAEILTQALRVSPQDAGLATWLGHIEIELHQYPAAIDILGQVHSKDPQSADALRDLANAFYLNENYAEAIVAMDQLAKLEPPKPGSWFFRAVCYDKLARKAEAIEAYQKFLDQDSGQHDTQDFQARHRIIALQAELKQSPRR